jgi:hypothetical protein
MQFDTLSILDNNHVGIYFFADDSSFAMIVTGINLLFEILFFANLLRAYEKVLSFSPRRLPEVMDLLRGKELFYMDFEGRMKSLADQFQRLGSMSGIPITRSTSTSIIDAYQNDFKINLYQ